MPPVKFFDAVSMQEAAEHLRRALELDPDDPASGRIFKWVIILSISTIAALT